MSEEQTKPDEKSADDERRDETLKRMLETPPKPHKPKEGGQEKPDRPTND